MYIKINIDGYEVETEKAYLVIQDKNKYWIPFSATEKREKTFIIVKDFILKDKKIKYEKVSLKSLINKNLKPLKNLVNENIISWFPKELMKHQKEAFDFAKKLKSVALFMEMGLGKSKLYIDLTEYHFFVGNINKVIFFAPPTTLHNFKNELIRWSITSFLNNWTIKSISFLSKSPKDSEIIDFISNIDNKTMIIIDESHRIKNMDSNCSKNAGIIGKKTNYKIIGTGTSAPNYVMDLIGQFRFLTPDLIPQSNSGLKKLYRISNKGIKIDVKNEVSLLSNFYPYIFSLKKEDAIKLPDLVIKNIPIEDEKLIDFYKRNIADVTSHFMSDEGTLLGFLQNLRKLSTGRDKQDNIIVENPKSKMLKDLLIDIPQNKKIIIWHSFYCEINDIVEYLDGEYMLLNGNMTDYEKIHSIDEFKSNTNIRFLIATAQVGGVGLNFTEAEHNIYFSNGFNLIDRLQSMSRSHRIGQFKQVFIYDLENISTIDSRILESLDKKEDFMQELNKCMKKGKEYVVEKLQTY